MSYNVHLLTHTVQAVEQWGPLWASSAFIFEDANRHLLRSLHGANSVSSQVFSNYIAARHLNPLAARYISASEDSIVIESFQKLSGLQVHGKTAVQLDSGIVGLGMRKPTRLAVKEILALESLLDVPICISKIVFVVFVENCDKFYIFAYIDVSKATFK